MLKFALIGCGRIAQRYAEILCAKKVRDASLAAVCDINFDRALSFSKQHQVPAFRNVDEMYQSLNGEIDVFSILTPSGTHAKFLLEAAHYKKHFVVEKPMALTLEDADQMIKACDKYGAKLFVVKQNRYNLPVVKLRQEFEAGRFGRLVMGTVRVRWCRTQDYYEQDAWRGTWAMDGGVFANQASHHIDLLEWFLGEPMSVFAMSRTALADIEAEDTGVALVRFRNGALGVIEATTAARPKNLEGSLSIMGEKGTVEIGGFAVNQLKVWNFSEAKAGDDEALEKFKENPPGVYGFGHIAYLQNVVDNITRNSPALVDGLEGRKSLELITAIYESIETGKEVFLHFEPQKCRLGLNS